MLYQIGQALLRTSDGLLQNSRMLSFNLNAEVETIEARGFAYDTGPAQVLDSAKSSEKFVLTLTQVSTDNLDLQLFMDEIEQTTASIAVPFDRKITVPSTGSYTVTETGLTVDQAVSAVVLSDTAPLRLEQIASAGVPASGEFEVTADTITFNAAQAGATVVIWYLKTETSLVTMGGTALRQQYGEMSFSGLIKGTRVEKRIWIPRIVRTSGATIGVSDGDPTETEMTFDCLTPAGWSLPFVMWDVA